MDLSPVVRYVRGLATRTCAGALTDAQLLDAFVTRGDEAAFGVLLERHGPKVLGICRRVLRREQDAEDAFQAAFLVLVRCAGSIGKGEAVGSWLYRVAYRLALRAKVRASKRPTASVPLADVPAAERTPNVEWLDLQAVFDEEINRLPAKYRAPFILCYLDGRTNEEAAHELGCPKGTVLSRLAWARERLRVRLARRGLAPAAGLLPLLANESTAAVRAPLADSTRRSAALFAAGKTVTTVLPAEVLSLMKGALPIMVSIKGGIVSACALAVGALGIGVVLAQQTVGDKTGAGQAASEPATKADRPPRKANAAKSEPKTFTFEMRDKPWPFVFEWYAEISGLPYVGQSKPTGTFTFIPTRNKTQYTLTEITDILGEALLAQKYLLVRRETSFTVLPADEKVDPILVPQIRPEDLDNRGKTELVRVVMPLNAGLAVNFEGDVRKLLGRFGDVMVMEWANQLIIQDTAGNLQRIRDMVLYVEKKQEAAKKQELLEQQEAAKKQELRNLKK